jgi:hypothetical protein
VREIKLRSASEQKVCGKISEDVHGNRHIELRDDEPNESSNRGQIVSR